MKVQHKKTGRVAEVLSKDEKLVRVHYIQEDTEQNMTVGTFKRWWKEIDEEGIAGDGAALSEVRKEIAAEAERRAEEAKRKAEQTKRAIETVKKMSPSQVFSMVEKVVSREKRKKFEEEFIDFCKSNNLSLKTWEKSPSLYAIQIELKTGKFKTIAEVRFGKKSYHIYCRERALVKGARADLIKNYYLPMSVKNISYSDTKVYKKIVESEVKNYGKI